MKLKPILLVCLFCCLLPGCAKKVRSISQSGYHDSYTGACSRELDEFDVLGLDRTTPVSEEEIQRVSRQSKPLQLSTGSTVLLIQSGAIYPDGPMVAELSKHFRVVPFTGVADAQPTGLNAQLREQTTRNVTVITAAETPVTIIPLATLAREHCQNDPSADDAAAYSRLLRLAAAKAGANTVVCYWGMLESGDEKLATQTVSWLPVLNWIVPDERQHTRIRLKVALVDVPTGNWTVFSTAPLEVKSWSVRPRREVTDQKQVESLKHRAYELAARDLLNAYAGGEIIR